MLGSDEKALVSILPLAPVVRSVSSHLLFLTVGLFQGEPTPRLLLTTITICFGFFVPKFVIFGLSLTLLLSEQ